MTNKDAIRSAWNLVDTTLQILLGDLSDADLLVRPLPNANHIAWQLGHLIAAETRTAPLLGGQAADLPAGFAEQHAAAAATQPTPEGFLSKGDYLALLGKVRAASLAALEQVPDSRLDEPTPGPMAKLAPTIGDMLMLSAIHVTMHAGQFTVVRRKIGKPVLF